MFDPDRPIFAPILLPGDLDAFTATGSWPAAILAPSQWINPQGRRLCALARSRAATLLVDPKTACYQYEGYMSMEDLRAVPYSPGSSTLGNLWEPRDFATAEQRAHLCQQVFELQRQMQADVLMAPYFFVPTAEHPWLSIAADTLAEALRRGVDRPVGGLVCVDIDALLGPGRLRAVASAYESLKPELWVVVVVNHDERAASPVEMRAVLALIESLAATAPVIHAYAGRGGLVAAASGALGYACGGLELEAHPKRYLREGLINLHPNSYYLPGCMVQLPTRQAEAVATAVPEALGTAPARPPITRQLARQRGAAALAARHREVRELGDAGDRGRWLRRRFDTALECCNRAREALAGGPHELTRGDYHYLEVLREVIGGPSASVIERAGL